MSISVEADTAHVAVRARNPFSLDRAQIVVDRYTSDTVFIVSLLAAMKGQEESEAGVRHAGVDGFAAEEATNFGRKKYLYPVNSST